MRELILDCGNDVPVVQFSKQLFYHHLKQNLHLVFYMHTYCDNVLQICINIIQILQRRIRLPVVGQEKR